jgi:hypothetical protein
VKAPTAKGNPFVVKLFDFGGIPGAFGNENRLKICNPLSAGQRFDEFSARLKLSLHFARFPGSGFHLHGSRPEAGVRPKNQVIANPAGMLIIFQVEIAV